MSKIRFLIMDVDGTLTDGKIYMSESGELFKAFDIKDGCGIYRKLRPNGIEPIIITGRSSEIVKRRCEELDVRLLFQGVSDKVEQLNTVLRECSINDKLEYSFDNCAYIGDDLPDYECMKQVYERGGITACPADAIEEIKEISTYICKKEAGRGAVREFIDWILERRK